MYFPNTIAISAVAFTASISSTSARPNSAVTPAEPISYLSCGTPPNNTLGLSCQASNGKPNGIFCNNGQIEDDVGVYKSEACRTCKCATQGSGSNSGQSFANFNSNAGHGPSVSVNVRPSGQYSILSCGGSTTSTLTRECGGSEEVSCDGASMQPSGLKNANPNCGGCICIGPNAGSASSSASATSSAAAASATATFKVDCGNATVPDTFMEPGPWKVASASLYCQKKVGATCQAVGGPFSFVRLDKLDICKAPECNCGER